MILIRIERTVRASPSILLTLLSTGLLDALTYVALHQYGTPSKTRQIALRDAQAIWKGKATHAQRSLAFEVA